MAKSDMSSKLASLSRSRESTSDVKKPLHPENTGAAEHEAEAAKKGLTDGGKKTRVSKKGPKKPTSQTIPGRAMTGDYERIMKAIDRANSNGLGLTKSEFVTIVFHQYGNLSFSEFKEKMIEGRISLEKLKQESK